MRIKVTYRSARTGQPTTVEGVEVEGRYPHLYLTLDVGTDVLRIPLEAIIEVQR